MQMILPSASMLKKIFVLIICILIVCLFLSRNQLKLSINDRIISNAKDELIDFLLPRINLNDNNDLILASVDDDNESVPKIHFVECSGRNIFTLKQLCVIESAANHHPQYLIQVWIFGHGFSNKLQEDSNFKFIQTQYPNIRAISMDVKKFVEKSEAQNLWNRLRSSKYYISHLSDVLRVLIVKNFGGIYLDLDALILKPLPPAPNFIGRENDDYVAGGLIKFQKNHPLGLFESLDNH